MTAKQLRQINAKLNKAMLLLQDAQSIIAGTDAEIDAEDFVQNYQRNAIHLDLSKAINEIHWASGKLEI